MVLFAEGTSSDGNRVLPFRSALIGAAKAAMASAQDDDKDKGATPQKVWIQPLSIAYTALHGVPMGRQHRHMAAWYGDMDLVPHLWALMKEGALDVTLTYGEPILYDPLLDRKEATHAAETSVRQTMLHDLHHYTSKRRRK